MLKKGKNERNLKGTIEELKGIEKGLSLILEDLKVKIEKLKSERTEIIEEIDVLKKEGKRRKGSLENEIELLRKEVEDLQKILVKSKYQLQNEPR